MIPGILVSCSDLCKVFVKSGRLVVILLRCLPTVRPEAVFIERVYLNRCPKRMYTANVCLKSAQLCDFGGGLDLVQHTLA